MKLDRFFQNSVFAGFVKTDHESDFYSVYGKLFTKLDKEEEDEEEVGVHHDDAVNFGDENSSKEEVYAFYKDWIGFCSIKKFAFVDVYDPREAPNRRIKRLIENDNNRVRNRERLKFNDKMNDLILHVRGKDPRWKAFQAEEAAIRNARKREQEEERKIKHEEDTEKLRAYREDLAEFYKKEEEEALLRGDIEEVFEEEFRCGMCKKSFKKEGQFDNHMRSKQHKKMEVQVKALREELELDEETEEQNASAQAEILKNVKAAEEAKLLAAATLNEDGEVDSDEEAIQSRKKMNKATKGVPVQVAELDENDLVDIDEWTHKKKTNNKKKKTEKNVAEKRVEEKHKKVESTIKNAREKIFDKK